MISSRCLGITKLTTGLARNFILKQNKQRPLVNQQIRHGSDVGEVHYRKTVAHPEREKLANFVGGFFWWWVVWHLLTDFHEVIGEAFPDPSTWTDEELGIPPPEAFSEA